MKNNLLRMFSCAILLLGAVNNVSYTMEDNNINEQISNNINNNNTIALQNKSMSSDNCDTELMSLYDNLCNNFKKTYNEIYDKSNECLMQLEKLAGDDIQNIKDCIKICNEYYIRMPETVEVKLNLYMLELQSYYKLNRDLRYQNDTLRMCIKCLKSKIQLCAETLKSRFTKFTNFKNYDSKYNQKINENLIEFKKAVNNIHEQINKLPDLQLVSQKNNHDEKTKVYFDIVKKLIKQSENLNHYYNNELEKLYAGKEKNKQYIDEMYYGFNGLNIIYNDCVDLYTTLKTKSTQYSEVIKYYEKHINELYTILYNLAVKIDNQNRLRNRLYPIMSSIFNIFKLFLQFR